MAQQLSHSRLPWQRALLECITSKEELFQELGLGSVPPSLTLPHKGGGDRKVSPSPFPLRVPRSFVARMKKGDIHDPLLRQVLPVTEELMAVPGYSQDPLQESAASPIPGLLHKYHGRVLLVLTGACAIHCRYCFRRHFPYHEQAISPKQWDTWIAYIKADSSIEEVILSGGDPLVLPDPRLKQLIKAIAQIRHVKRLRVHTRLIITIPERITPQLIEGLCATRLTPILVTHVNHPNEIDHSVTEGMLALRQAGITLLNQAVLLRGINDTVPCLVALSQKLFDCQILPYYLHLIDRVAGAAHFEVDEKKAKYLIGAIAEQLPGYLVPKLVREEAGAKSKNIISAT